MKKRKQTRHRYYLLTYGGEDAHFPPTVVSVYRSLWENAKSWSFQLRAFGAYTHFERIHCMDAYARMRHGFEVLPFYKVKDYLYRVVKLYAEYEEEQLNEQNFENCSDTAKEQGFEIPF